MQVGKRNPFGTVTFTGIDFGGKRQTRVIPLLKGTAESGWLRLAPPTARRVESHTGTRYTDHRCRRDSAERHPVDGTTHRAQRTHSTNNHTGSDQTEWYDSSLQ